MEGAVEHNVSLFRGGQFISPHAQVKAAAAAISFLSVRRCRYPLHARKGFAADQALIQSRGNFAVTYLHRVF